MMQGVILAAGKGSRLHPITISRSKAMLPILGQPIVARVVDSIAACGVKDFILVVSPDDTEIREYFQKYCVDRLNIRFVYQPERKGMADALKYAVSFIHGDFILSACDNLFAPDDICQIVKEWNRKPKLNAILSLIKVSIDEIPRSGMVIWDGDWVKHIVEKPSPGEIDSQIASLPLYCFSKRILGYLPQVNISVRGEYELQDAIQMMIERNGKVLGYLLKERFTITSAQDLLTVNRYFLENDGRANRINPDSVGQGTILVEPLYIEKGTIIGREGVIGPNVYIERDCIIGDGVILENAVLLRGAIIPDDVIIRGEVIS